MKCNLLAVCLVSLFAARSVSGYRDDRAECCGSWGGEGIFTPHILWLDDDFVRDILSDPVDSIAYRDYDRNNRSSYGIGFMGYADASQGIRFGGGLWVSYRNYQEQSLAAGSIFTAGSSSTAGEYVNLHVLPAYAGFILEKSFDMGVMDIFGGGLFGGGAYTILKHRELSEDYYYSADYPGVDTVASDETTAAVAPFIAFDLHGGTNFELTPIFHLGIEFYALFTHSPGGFVTGTRSASFSTVNPGIRLRIAFGKRSV
ncbi:MAG: hypothetical protein GF398_12135 [Chitinivibrionales bacterium]|nr:hypothetical protein [Chitinivibrionales bacterium]